MDNLRSTKFQNNSIVTLHVGPDKLSFHVHQELLFKSSPVFKAAVSGACRESSEHCMALPEDDSKTVERLLQWLYFKSLAKLNTLANKFDVALLKNSIIDELFAIAISNTNSLPPLAIAYIYENTTETSSLRKQIVGWYAWLIDSEWYTDSGTSNFLENTPMLASDLAIAMSQILQNPSVKSPFCSEPSS